MQWTAGDNAGFCPPDAAPWLPVNEHNKHERNVERQQADGRSLLNLYRALLTLRRETPALHAGTLTLLDGTPTHVLGYMRRHENQSVVVLLNFGKKTANIPLENIGAVLLDTSEVAGVATRAVTLPARSAIITTCG